MDVWEIMDGREECDGWMYVWEIIDGREECDGRDGWNGGM